MKDWNHQAFGPNFALYQHTTRILGNKVNIIIKKKRNVSDITFRINDSINAEKAKVPREHALPIMRHITSKLQEYVDNVKPEIIQYQAEDMNDEKARKKGKLYASLMKILQNKQQLKEENETSVFMKNYLMTEVNKINNRKI